MNGISGIVFTPEDLERIRAMREGDSIDLRGADGVVVTFRRHRLSVSATVEDD